MNSIAPRAHSLAFTLTFILLLAYGAPAAATQVFYVPMEKMAVESEVIVHARVVAQRVTWDDAHARILTLTTIEVLDGIKGAETGEQILIYQVGGTLDGITFDIPGALRFVAGQEMIFFAIRFGDMIASYGMGQGKWILHERDGVAYVAPEFGDVAWVTPQPGGLAPAAAPRVRPETLSNFLGRIDAALRTGGGR